MRFRPMLCASLSLGVLVSPMGRRAAVTTKYRLEVKAETTIDLSAFGQGTQVQNANLSAWINVTLSDSVGGRVLHVIVDSVAYAGTAPVPQESLDSAKHAVVHGFVDALGRVKNLTATPSNSLLVGQVQGMMNSFFPKVKAGAKAGDAWTDTTEVKNNSGGNNTNVKLVIDYVAGAGEVVGGIPATKLNVTTHSTITGTLENPMAGTMEVEGTGQGTGSVLIGSDGRFLGGRSSSNVDQKLKVAMAPNPIPVKTVQSVVVTLLK